MFGSVADIFLQKIPSLEKNFTGIWCLKAADQFGKSAAVLVTQKEQNLLFRICELEEPAKMRSGGHYEREYFEVRSI